MEIIIKLYLMCSSDTEQLPYLETQVQDISSLQKVLASVANLEFYRDPKHYQEEDAVSL